MTVFAQEGQQIQQKGALDGLLGILPFLAIFVVFYFLLIRPQQKKQKELQQQIQQLKEGDTVITAGGVKGKIVKLKDESLVIESEDTKLEILKVYVTQVIKK